jgi:hypothetical protein
MNVFINKTLTNENLQPGLRKTRAWYQDILKSQPDEIKENPDFKFYTNTINLLAEANIFLSYNEGPTTGGNQRGGNGLDNLEAIENANKRAKDQRQFLIDHGIDPNDPTINIPQQERFPKIKKPPYLGIRIERWINHE